MKGKLALVILSFLIYPMTAMGIDGMDSQGKPIGNSKPAYNTKRPLENSQPSGKVNRKTGTSRVMEKTQNKVNNTLSKKYSSTSSLPQSKKSRAMKKTISRTQNKVNNTLSKSRGVNKTRARTNRKRSSTSSFKSRGRRR